ncbi:TlpA family protein disulfide reductase [Pedobacter sp. MC2016-14]|uniref:TlpA disulfide reductase family protein n=1 Tax=Pedobacter sp. MC2016-14 TaxID=2897327 RepID=UPI001E2D7535|nr:TlpA disulfide reductase family protein [Pedobacter sp. MC2016-14]MCD0490527.1 TlpA family protein disulfide reductase [Pedobacter sp. MC2016-14]
MRTIYIPLLLLLFVVTSLNVKAQQIADFPDIGDDIMPEYPKVEWLKGNPVTQFDKDKIYIVELWATWCKPCIAAMPHLNALHLKFKDKGVIFIGQDVMEDDKAKVEAFVKEMGDAISYNIAYSGDVNSDFNKKWVKAAAVSSIPQTFVIQHNKLVWQTHPFNLNEAVMQLLIEDKFSIDAAKALLKK